MNRYNKPLQAFPYSGVGDDTNYSRGMSLRDYFAAKAMQSAYFHFSNDEDGHTKHWTSDGLAKSAYAMADAMLKARAI